MKINENRFNENEVRTLISQVGREAKTVLLEHSEKMLAMQEGEKNGNNTPYRNSQAEPAKNTELTPEMIARLTDDEKRQLYICILLLQDISAAIADGDLSSYIRLLRASTGGTA